MLLFPQEFLWISFRLLEIMFKQGYLLSILSTDMVGEVQKVYRTGDM